MKENYRSIEEQNRVISRKPSEDKKWYLLCDNTLTSKNPYLGKNQFSNVVDERKRFLRETGRL